jgi:transposase
MKLESKISAYADKSDEAKLLQSIPGFGPVCSAEIAGEIGTIERFSKESSLSLYMGMSTLDNSSGKYKGGKQPKHVNTRAKAAMMIAVDHHRKYVAESQTYYEKKRKEGKKHNQAIRSLGRHLMRVIFQMLKEKRAYREKTSLVEIAEEMLVAA